MTVEGYVKRRFSVALSFPGEARDFAEALAKELAKTFAAERILYDKWHEAEFARLNLDVYLPNLYRTQAELIVPIFTADYAHKRWCELEWRHIRQLLATADERRIMPLRDGFDFDLTELGVLAGDGFVNIKGRPAVEIAALVVARHAQETGARRPAPRTPAPAASAPAAPVVGAAALAIWRRKLEFLLAEEPKIVDPEARFALQTRIEEAEARIRALAG